MKFKRPATSNNRAQAEIMEENKERFEKQLERKGWATIEVAVNVLDKDGIITRNYEWFAQKIYVGQQNVFAEPGNDVGSAGLQVGMIVSY